MKFNIFSYYNLLRLKFHDYVHSTIDIRFIIEIRLVKNDVFSITSSRQAPEVLTSFGDSMF